MGYIDGGLAIERMKTVRFLLIGFAVLFILMSLRSCSDKLPNWMVGESKQELAVKAEVLTGQVEQAQQVIAEINENNEKKQEAEVVVKEVLKETKAQAKVTEKKVQAKTKVYTEKVEAIELDQTKTPEQRDAELVEVTVDSIWDAYEEYRGKV